MFRRCVIYLILALSVFSISVFANPLQNGTTFQNGTTIQNGTSGPAVATEPAFKLEPKGRGTIGLLTACVITFSLCVWTAIHPNVIPDPRGWRQVQYRLFWTAVCVGLPEAIVLCAFGQWLKAREIRAVWRAKYKEKHQDIGLTGGFFVVMGGITVGDKMEGRPNTTLTCDGFEKYVNEGHITPADFSERAATDKGRATALVKVLVFGQAGWFVMQCFARVFHGLPATLLEIHVVIQVLYVFAAYGFWFYKPLDVSETIHLDIQLPPPENDYPEDSVYLLPRRPLPLPLTEDGTPGPPWVVRLTVTEDVRDGVVILGLRAFYDIGEHIGYGRTTVGAAILTSLNGICHAAAWNTHFPTSVEAWLWRGSSLAVFVVPFFLALFIHHGNYRKHTGPILWESRFTEQVTAYQQSKDFVCRVRREISLIAWNSVSSSDQMSPFQIFMCAVTLTLYFFYILCMTYITLESFISIRSLQLNSYATPQWTQNVPHVS